MKTRRPPWAKDRQFPDVLAHFGSRVGDSQTGVAGQRPQQMPILVAGRLGQIGKRSHLSAAGSVKDPGQGCRPGVFEPWRVRC